MLLPVPEELHGLEQQPCEGSKIRQKHKQAEGPSITVYRITGRIWQIRSVSVVPKSVPWKWWVRSQVLKELIDKRLKAKRPNKYLNEYVKGGELFQFRFVFFPAFAFTCVYFMWK